MPIRLCGRNAAGLSMQCSGPPAPARRFVAGRDFSRRRSSASALWCAITKSALYASLARPMRGCRGDSGRRHRGLLERQRVAGCTRGDAMVWPVLMSNGADSEGSPPSLHEGWMPLDARRSKHAPRGGHVLDAASKGGSGETHPPSRGAQSRSRWPHERNASERASQGDR